VRESWNALQWLSKLVAHDTTSSKSNLLLIEEIETYLQSWGFICQKSFDDDKRKANLLATIGDPTRAGIMFSGHTDVVPVSGQSWSSDPFQLSIRGARAYGRGTCDMKGFLAVLLKMVPDWVRVADQQTTHLAFSYDEEIGCVGARRLVPLISNLPTLPKGCIVGEPTSMRLILGHKGKSSYHVNVRGCECHSSMPEDGVNAVEIAAELIYTLSQQAKVQRTREGDHRFDPPYTTIHTGTVHGGTALNIVPGACAFDFEMRHLPWEDPASLLTHLDDQSRRILDERAQGFDQAKVQFDMRSSYPGLLTQENQPFVTQIKKALGTSDQSFVSFGTEAGLYSQAGIPTVVLGPGAISQAHKPDEFVELGQLIKCEAVLTKLLTAG
jgi:acetylornithine deacetylase